MNGQIRIIKAYPPQLWDSKTRVLQPEMDLRHGTRKLGALLVEFKEARCILIFGVTYWELTPWCEVIPLVPIERSIRFSNAYDRSDEESNEFGSYGESYLKDVFDSFQVKDVKIPTDMHTRRHECPCDTLKVMSVAQLRNVSGKDMYLLYLHYMSDDLSEKLKEFNIR
jgi:hypothetical protein